MEQRDSIIWSAYLELKGPTPVLRLLASKHPEFDLKDDDDSDLDIVKRVLKTERKRQGLPPGWHPAR